MQLARLCALVLTAATTLTVQPASALAGAAHDAPSSNRLVQYKSWTSTADFAHGTKTGVRPAHGAITFARPAGTLSYTDPFGDGTARNYEYADWISPTVRPGFGLTELVASWNATTPTGTWVEISLSGKADTGATSKWYVLGRWTKGDSATDIHRTSVPAQGDTIGRVSVDTFVAATDRSLNDWRLRVRLLRPAGSHAQPSVGYLGAMASRLPADETVPVSGPGGAWGRVLPVPTYSQEMHLGHYPQWDSGGEAWCSPTSTAMVLDYWRHGPSAAETAWVDPSDPNPQVDHSARSVFDYDYDGAGNWPFNAAYAGTRGLEGFVTRLRSLTEAEQFIKAGIPLVASLSFESEDMDGAGYGTNGHLMVIVGFAPNGDVVVNDPASHLIPSNDQVRTTYKRAQFENAWIPHSGGIVYVMRPEGVRLPPSQGNW